MNNLEPPWSISWLRIRQQAILIWIHFKIAMPKTSCRIHHNSSVMIMMTLQEIYRGHQSDLRTILSLETGKMLKSTMKSILSLFLRKTWWGLRIPISYPSIRCKIKTNRLPPVISTPVWLTAMCMSKITFNPNPKVTFKQWRVLPQFLKLQLKNLS